MGPTVRRFAECSRKMGKKKVDWIIVSILSLSFSLNVDIINIYTERAGWRSYPHLYMCRGREGLLYIVGTITTVTTSSGGSFLAAATRSNHHRSLSMYVYVAVCVCVYVYYPGRQSRALWLLLSVSCDNRGDERLPIAPRPRTFKVQWYIVY